MSMDYIECQFKIEPFQPFNEILVAQLSDLEFESFVEEEDEQILKAYIEQVTFGFIEKDVAAVIESFSSQAKIDFSSKLIKKENWNKKWEENFDAVEVGTFCYVRAPFHAPKPNFTHEIVIEPKMSFGTGHHQTTQMMIELMESINFEKMSVMDMGSGTGILAILAKKMKAGEVEAIDIEEWAYENMKENFQRNGVEVKSFLGDATLLKGKHQTFDVILANINKNILLSDFAIYNKALKNGGYLFLSGFYQSDEEDILASESLQDYAKVEMKIRDGWCGLKLQKA